ncbi:MAG: hypothetical protein IKH16_00825 [Selenomonadaceae bacterium]|nr:hypothetical protein [Selenomonadaceae bacterium]
MEEKEKKEYEERQQAEKERIESGETVDEVIHRYVGYSCKEFARLAAESTKQFYVCFDVPASEYEAMLRMVGREPEWSLYVDVKIRGTNKLFSNIYSKIDDPGMHSRKWLIEQVKTPEAHEFIFHAIKHLCERIDRD